MFVVLLKHPLSVSRSGKPHRTGEIEVILCRLKGLGGLGLRVLRGEGLEVYRV